MLFYRMSHFNTENCSMLFTFDFVYVEWIKQSNLPTTVVYVLYISSKDFSPSDVKGFGCKEKVIMKITGNYDTINYDLSSIHY